MSSSAQVILPLAFRNKALDTAIFVASAMYVGKLREDPKLQELAMASYPAALARFRSGLVSFFDSKAKRSQSDIVLAILLSLLLFEVRFSRREILQQARDLPLP